MKMILSIWVKNKWNIVKQEGFYPYGYMSDFEKFKEKLPSKEKFYDSLTNRKINDKEYEHVLNNWNKFEMKTMKYYHDLYLKCGVLLLADVFEKFRNNSLKNYYVQDYVQVITWAHQVQVEMQCLNWS